MNAEFEPLLNCPRTGFPCPLLMEVAFRRDEARDRASILTFMGVGIETDAAMDEIEREVLREDEDGYFDEEYDGDKNDVIRELREGLRESVAGNVAACDQNAEDADTIIQMTRNTCTIGPLIRRKAGVLSCTSLLARSNR